MELFSEEYISLVAAALVAGHIALIMLAWLLGRIFNAVRVGPVSGGLLAGFTCLVAFDALLLGVLVLTWWQIVMLTNLFATASNTGAVIMIVWVGACVLTIAAFRNGEHGRRITDSDEPPRSHRRS